ncbi:MAG: DUF6531 domain-containing protein [Verrucomicrobiia bacterium]
MAYSDGRYIASRNDAGGNGHTFTTPADANNGYELWVGNYASAVRRYNAVNGVHLGYIGDTGDSNGSYGPGEIFWGADTNTCYVARYWAHKVLSYSRQTGEYLSTVTTTAADPASSACFGLDGAMYVGSDYCYYIQRVDMTTGLVTTNFVYDTDHLVRVNQFVVGPEGDFYVANGNPDWSYYSGSATNWCNILRYDGRTGAFKNEFVASGTGDMEQPLCLEFGPDGHLYVCTGSPWDHAAARVLKFDGTTGSFLGTFVAADTNAPPAKWEMRMRFGPNGNLYMTDWQNNMVKQYNGSNGTFICNVATNVDAGNDSNRGPVGLAFTSPTALPPYLQVSTNAPTLGSLINGQRTISWGVTNWTGSSLSNTVHYSWTQNGTNYTAQASSTSGSGATTASVMLTGLNPQVTYSYWVQSVAYSDGRYIASRNDAGGNGHTFTTPADANNGYEMWVGNLGSAVRRYNAVNGMHLGYIGDTGEYTGWSWGATEIFWGADTNTCYVTRYWNHKVQAHNRQTGEYLSTVLTTGWGDPPANACFGADGALYVGFDYQFHIARVDSATGLTTSNFVYDTNHLVRVNHFVVGPEGDFYVANGSPDWSCYPGGATNWNNILRFDGRTGAFKNEFVVSGSGDMEQPFCLEFGPDGHLYVCAGNRWTQAAAKVLKFDGTTGSYLGTFVAADTNAPPARWEMRMRFGPNGNLYMTDWKNNMVKQYNGTNGTFICNVATNVDISNDEVNRGPVGLAFTSPTALPPFLQVSTNAPTLGSLINGQMSISWGVTNWTGSSLNNTVHYSWTQNGTNYTAQASSTSGSGGSTASVTLTGLNPSAMYHYWVQSVAYSNGRYIASRNDDGGNGHTFGTPMWVAVSDLCYSNLSTESVDIHWNVQNDSSLTATHTILFEDGLGTFTNVFTDVGPGSTNVILSVSNLMAGVTYSYHAVSYVNDANGYGSNGVSGYCAFTNGTFTMPAAPLVQIADLYAYDLQADNMGVCWKVLNHSTNRMTITFKLAVGSTNNVVWWSDAYNTTNAVSSNWWHSSMAYLYNPICPTTTYYCITDVSLGGMTNYSSAVTNGHSVLEVTTPDWLSIPLSPTVIFGSNGAFAFSWIVDNYFTNTSAWVTNSLVLAGITLPYSNPLNTPYQATRGWYTFEPAGSVLDFWVKAYGSDGVNSYSVTNNAGGTNYSLPTLPEPLQTANSLATTERFVRGTGSDPTYHSFVIPLSQQKGVALNSLGSNTFNGVVPWVDKATWNTYRHYSYTNDTNSFLFKKPIAAFGSGVGGTPLHIGQNYGFAVYSGYPPADFGHTLPDVQILVYSNYGSSCQLVGYANVYVPRKTNSLAWAQFASNGFSQTTDMSVYGLKTTLTLTDASSAEHKFGVNFQSCSPFILTHTASAAAANYYFLVQAIGAVPNSSVISRWSSSVDQAGATPAYNALYALEFEPLPAWRSIYVAQPQFQGEPLPQEYANKSLDELISGLTTTNVALSTSSTNLAVPNTYTNLNASPELRRHPLLDKLVSDLKRDPLALAAYVQNEIELTDALGYNTDGSVTEDSINPCGVNRGALGVLLERQGSPIEQCALLVYLMRQAGYPAAYAFPKTNTLKMLDVQMSRMLRMQIKGAVDSYGDFYTTNTMLSVNYPWVTVYLTNSAGVAGWTNLFPWIKDTEVVEGLDIGSVMPSTANIGRGWIRNYLCNTNLAVDSLENDTPVHLLVGSITNYLAANDLTHSIADIGVRAVNRRKNYTCWGDFPHPLVTSTNNARVLESLSQTNTIFDTVSVKIFSQEQTNVYVQTTPMYMAEVHNRKLLAWHTKTNTSQHCLSLYLAPFCPGSTNINWFGTNWCNAQATNVTLDSRHTNLLVRIEYKRQRNLGNRNPGSGFLNFNEGLEMSQDRPFSKGDMAAICFNVGRVTPEMTRVHANEFWAYQTQTGATASVQVYPGSLLCLMGMEYYRNCSESRAVLQNLYKTTMLSSYAHGLAKLAANKPNGILPADGTINLVAPNVDMMNYEVAFAGYGTLHADIPADQIVAQRNFQEMFMTDGSAQEHRIINQFWNYTNSMAAISTVKLLQLAQLRKASLGGTGMIEVTSANLNTVGNYMFYGKRLSEHAPSIWSQISNSVVATTANYPGSYYNVAFVTPGPVTNKNYRGLGALIFNVNSWWALITENQTNTLNGGYAGASLGSTAITLTSTPSTIPWYLSYASDGYCFNYVSTTSTTPLSLIGGAVPVNNVGLVWTSVATNSSVFSKTLSIALYNSVSVLNSSAPANWTSQTQANAFRQVSSTGVLQSSSLDNSVQAQTSWWGDVKKLVADPVNPITGEFYIDATDLHLPGPMPIQVRRNYTSQNLADNEFGYGWKINYEPYLCVTANTNMIYAAETDGSVVAYEKQGTNLVWVPTPGLNPMLNNVSHGQTSGLANMFNAKLAFTNGTYYLTGPDNSRRTFVTMSFTNSSLVVTRPYLTEWKDNRGNKYTFSYGTTQSQPEYGKLSRVDSSNGNFIGFNYDVLGHITEAYTRDGRRIRYDYDDYGDLVTVMLPTGHAFQYEYEHAQTNVNGQTQWYSTHLMLRETKPEGRVLENDYDIQRRVTEQRATGGTSMTPVRNASFAYSNSGSTGVISGYTTITDCFNNVTRYDYTNSLITQIMDPLGHSIVQEWFYTNAPSIGGYQRSLKSSTDKRGLKTEYVYDTQGNITSSTESGDLTGAGGSQTNATSYSYDTTNRLRSVSVTVGGTLHQTVNSYDNNVYPFLPRQVQKTIGGTTISTTTLDYGAVTNGTLVSYGLLTRETRTGIGCNVSSVSDWTYANNGFPASLVRSGGGITLLTQSFRYDWRGNVVEMTDSTHGRKCTYDYDAAGNRTAQEVWDTATGALVSWKYDYYNGNGEVEWSEGPRYNPSDFVWQEHDGAGHVKEQIRWRSQAKSDGSGVEAGSGDSLYAITKYEHDAFGNQTKATDARGNQVTMAYDAVGQMTSRTFSAGGTETFTYEPGGLVASHVNVLGSSTLKQYTSRGQIKSQTNPDGTTQSWRYDVLGRVVLETLPNSQSWTTAYTDAAQRVDRTFSGSNPSASETKIFDGRGNLIQWTDVAGAVFNRTYDGLDRVTNETGPAANQQTTTYTYNGQTTSVAKGGVTTATTVDALDRPKTVSTGSDAARTAYSYSSDHHSVMATVGSGGNAISTTTWTDTLGKTVLVKNAAGNFTLNEYDQVENLTATQDELGNRTRFIYDGMNRVNGKILPDGKLVAFTYDLAGNMLSRQMPGLTWQASYDSAGRITSEKVNGSQRSITYAYYTDSSRKGLLSTVTEGGVEHTYDYDNLMRVSSITSGGLSRTFTRDARGLLTSVTGPGTTVSRVYDGYGQLQTETVSTGSGSYQLSQAWDSAGRRTSLSDASGSRLNYTFGYDSAGRLGSVGNATAGTFSYVYADNDLLTSRTHSSRTVAISRDSLGRETGRTTTVGVTTPLNETLGWRADSRMLSYTNSSGGGEGRAFAYNSRNQLTNENYGTTSPSSRTNLTHVFDVNGMGVRWYMQTNSALYWMQTDANIAWPAKLELSTSSTLYNYPAMGTAPGADSLSVKLDGNAVRDLYYDPTDTAGHWLAFLTLSPGSHTLSVNAYTNSMLAGGATNTFSSLGTNQTAQTTYDARGYAVKRVFLSNGSQLTQTLTWDGAGRLTAVSQRDQTSNNGYDWTALYDGLGRRLRTVYTPVDGGVACTKLAVTQESWYDPEVEFLELGVSVNGQKHWKMYGPDLDGVYGGLQGIGGLEAVINQSDGVVTPVVNDAFGNAVASVTNSTVVVWNPTRVGGYGPLPGSSAQWLSTNTTLAAATVWRGKRMDPTGYYWMGARYYDPVGGRFLSPDPLGHEASMDLYSYANGDPINDCDPDGRFGKQAWDAAKTGYGSFASQFYTTPEAQFVGTSIDAPSGWSPYVHGTTWFSDSIAQVPNMLSLANNTLGNTFVRPVGQLFATAEKTTDQLFGRGTWEAATMVPVMRPARYISSLGKLGTIEARALARVTEESPLWKVGRYADMPKPRPTGMQAHHGVNSVWMEENFHAYKSADAPTILMWNNPSHNATRVVFNRIQTEIAKRQGVSIVNIDWSAVSPGTAWRLAEEQMQAAKVPADVAEEFFRQFNAYLETLK